MGRIIVKQVTTDWVRENLGDTRIHRILLCDDGNYGHTHVVARMKPLKNMTIEEYNESISDGGQYAFITVEAVEE